MNLFGIPIFIENSMILEFLATYFPNVSLNYNEQFYVFLAINFFYLFFMTRVVIPFLYKCLMFVMNHIF